ncbi:MAG: MopE-related protein [Sandaracinaceae bacterium]
MLRALCRGLGALALAVLACLGTPERGRAYINQVDGTVLPVTGRLQSCLDRPGTGETMVGAVDALADAAVLPEAFRPVLDPVSGRYRVTFTDIGEGAGFRNSFGWFFTGDDVTDTANLRTIFGCRTYGTCDCPCATTRTVTIDFDLIAGFTPGDTIGFWLRTPERLSGTRESGFFDTGASYCTANVGCDPTTANLDDSCGGRLDSDNRIYFTNSSLNDDGDYVHFLVYESATRTNTFYFGFEDLFRGGDNDFEDMLVTASGLVPLCTPEPETCDDEDDDCDGTVDEGLTQACSTACGDGEQVCMAGTFGPCSARVPDPTETRCDALDDDCDGTIDEGVTRPCSNECGAGDEICISGMFADCSAPTPTFETCNNNDDDCDSTIDEGITRACASACGGGTEMCMAGAFVGCTAPLPTGETCDNTDQDCDGLTDEGPITRDCATACGVGTEVCVAGTFIGCSAPAVQLEVCNDNDDDCDGPVDEGITRACSTACGVGTETCTAGTFGGCDAPLPEPEICNNLDDDCNGVIDDGNPGGGADCLPLPDGSFTTPDGGLPDAGPEGLCLAGTVQCVAGELVCRGASSATREVCNCDDDDCDGAVDEGELCGGGSAECIDCRCATPCADGEFPCPPGLFCDRSLGDDGFCVAGQCAGVECSDEEICNPVSGECENVCVDINCQDGFACVRGRCVEDNCYGRGCGPGERCIEGACEADPCAGVDCEGLSFCREGSCVDACENACPEGRICDGGACVEDPCGGECTSSESCVDGDCVLNSCLPRCGPGRICDVDVCVDDPCASIDCPEGTACQAGGQCVGGDAEPPPRFGLATGGACQCSAVGTAPASGRTPVGRGFLVALLLGGALLRRRPVRRRLASRAAAAGVLCAALLGAGGCSVDPFCFDNCGDGGPVPVDLGPLPDFGVCEPPGEVEVCDLRDNDCDGEVDEDFDLDTDPSNCGACNEQCLLPSAFAACEDGECVVDECAVGFIDLNGVAADGCEYECQPSGDEICDGRDNDCIGEVDETFDLDGDVANCGECGNPCTFANAVPLCEGGECAMGDCRTGFVDLNDDDRDGCEYRCTATGAERCNRIDDNCDGRIDEGFDLDTDPDNCGACGNACTFLNGNASCVAGPGGSRVCALAGCQAGWVDLDDNPVTGCEYQCTPTGGIDDCDGVDDDCDGAIDNEDPMVGTPCGETRGACEAGVNSCQLGSIVCVGNRGPTPETCNGVDDDCNGMTDDPPGAMSLPGVGERCGATNIGICEFGTTACTGGMLACGGTFVGPATEVCNGADDDCNGALDDDLTPPAPSTVTSCMEQRGVCGGRIPDCRGAMGWQCDLPDTYQMDETLCDGLDNDCDGTDDEGCLGAVGTTDIRIDTGDSPTEHNSLSPFVLGDGVNRVWVSWMDLRLGAARIYFNRSINSGDTWLATPTRMDTDMGPAIGPRIALGTPDNVVVAWSDFRDGSFRQIYTRRSANYGVSFAASDTRVNPTGTTSSEDSFNVDLVAEGANFYLVFEAFVSARSRHIFFSRSTNGGSTWSTPIQLSTPAGTSFVAANPRVAAAGSNVYVIWRDNRNGALDVYLRRSTNSGSTFVAGEQRIDVGDAAGANNSLTPDIAALGGNVYAVWVDTRDMGSFDIYANRSIDSGSTWLSSAVQLDRDAFSHDSLEPHVAALSGGVVVATWIDLRSGLPDVLAARSTNRGRTWGVPERLDTGSAPGVAAAFDLGFDGEGDILGAAWADDRNGFLDIYANFSLDAGVTWQPSDIRLDTSTIGTSDSERPAVYVSDDAVHVVWVDHRVGAGCTRAIAMECPEGDIYYRRLE